MLHQPQAAQRYTECKSLQYRQSSEANFFRSGKRGPRYGDAHMRGKVHVCERPMGSLTNSPAQGAWSIGIDLAMQIHSCDRWQMSYQDTTRDKFLL